MRNYGLKLTGIILIVACGIAGYRWQLSSVAPSPTPDVPKTADKPDIQYPVAKTTPQTKAEGSTETLASSSASVTLDNSDETLLQALEKLFGHETLYSLFNTKEIVRSFAVTVSGATEQQLPRQPSIFKPLPDEFVVEQNAEGAEISAKNYVRYAKYIDLLNKIELRKLVAIYAQYYPLFQAAYVELGMSGYFNDRLVEAIDNALSTPDESGHEKLIHKGYYKFADPRLESLTATQKIMLRMGPENERLVKNKLKAIRQLLTHLNKA